MNIKYPSRIFDFETLDEKEDRKAMEGKIIIYDEHCEKCNGWAQTSTKGRFFCKKCLAELKEVKRDGMEIQTTKILHAVFY